MVVSRSALSASAGMLSGPAALPFLSSLMAFLISSVVGYPQLVCTDTDWVNIGGIWQDWSVQELFKMFCPSGQLSLFHGLCFPPCL